MFIKTPKRDAFQSHSVKELNKCTASSSTYKLLEIIRIPLHFRTAIQFSIRPTGKKPKN